MLRAGGPQSHAARTFRAALNLKVMKRIVAKPYTGVPRAKTRSS